MLNRIAVTLSVLDLSIALVWAHDEGPGSIEAHLHGLVEGGAITQVQHEQIERLYSTNHLSQLDAWLKAQETAGQITRDTHLYINALLALSAADLTPLAPAPAAYGGNGNVTLLGHLDSQPPNPYYGDNSSTGTLYTGMWGYAVGSREYALQSNSFGLHIIDLRTGDVAHWLRIDGVVRELYDVVSLPGVRRPRAIGFKTDEIRSTLSVGESAGL